jgi:hypothetical protein
MVIVLVLHLRLTVRLQVERRAHEKCDADQLEEVLPDVASEDGVPVAHDGGEPVEPHDTLEEHLGHRHGGVGVVEGEEVGVLGEAVHHRKDHRLVVHLG